MREMFYQASHSLIKLMFSLTAKNKKNMNCSNIKTLFCEVCLAND